MSRLGVDSIWSENTALGSIGKPRIVVEIYEIGKRQHLTQHPADKYRGKQTRPTACIVACSPPTASVFFWRRRLGSYHSQLFLSGRLKPLNPTHGTATATQLSKSWAFPVFGSIAWFSSRMADLAGGKIVLAIATIFFLGASAGVRCAMVCIRGSGCCPGRHPLWFMIYRLVWGRR